MAAATTARPRQKRQKRKGSKEAQVQERIMSYGLVQVGKVGSSLTHVYAKKATEATRCGLALEPRGEEVRNASFADYSEAECQDCCSLFGVARLWQIYPPMTLGEHLWDERGRRR